jgi:hypothetical protein
MAYKIEPRKVAGVMTEANRALEGKGFNHGEVVIGLTELLGRIIVDAASNEIQTRELIKVVHDHLESTIKIGSQATHKNIITPTY